MHLTYFGGKFKHKNTVENKKKTPEKTILENIHHISFKNNKPRKKNLFE